MTAARSWALRERWHLLALAVICAVGLAADHLAVTTRPFDTDNLVGLTIAKTSSVGDLFSGAFIATLPGYRPLPYLSLGVEDAILGIGGWHFFTINLMLVLACGCIVYALAHRVTGAVVASTIAGVAFVVDPRIYEALFWTGERQATMAAFLGAAAVLLAMSVADGPLHRRRLAAIGVLLLAAALSKEYGLAASAAVGTAALLAGRRGRPLLMVAFGVVGTYAILRFVVAGGANVPFCDTIGMKNTVRAVCYDTTREGFFTLRGSDRLVQYLWDIGATGLASGIPFMFSMDGAWLRSAQYAQGWSEAAFVTMSVVAVCGFVARPRAAAPLFVLVVVNALLSFLLFRTRNHLVGMVGMYAGAGVGLACAQSMLRAHSVRAATAMVAVVAVAAGIWAGWRIQDQNARLEKAINTGELANPLHLCGEAQFQGPVKGEIYISLDVVTELTHYYDVPDPDCRRARALRARESASGG